MTDVRGFRIAMVILAFAWGANLLALGYAMTRVPGAFGDPMALWALTASAGAVLGALLTRAFRMFGVVLYTAAALSLIVKSYIVIAGTSAPMQVGWPYLLSFVIFAGLVWSEWPRFKRPSA